MVLYGLRITNSKSFTSSLYLLKKSERLVFEEICCICKQPLSCVAPPKEFSNNSVTNNVFHRGYPDRLEESVKIHTVITEVSLS